MLFTTHFLTHLFDQTNKHTEVAIHHIMTDSRKHVENSLFIPLVGDRFDGHTYIEGAIDNGAVAALWQENQPLPEKIDRDFLFIFVPDTLIALQTLAAAYLQDVQPKVIGITGSNGKTTTKDLVFALFKQKYRTHRTLGNFNNHIGLPLTILQMERDTEVIILEMGMDSPGEIERLAHIARPDIAIITNIGESHIENFDNRAGIAQAKLEITSFFNEQHQLIVDGDEPLLKGLSIPAISCGFHVDNDMIISDVKIDEKSTTFMVQSNERYTIPLIGKHHAKNATYAIAVAKEYGLSYEEITAGFATVEHTSMRFEFLQGKNRAQIINDAYNASPTSMKAAIDVVKALSKGKKKIIVLGDILELGKYSESFHRSIADAIEPPIDIVFTYGQQAKFIIESLQERESTVQFQHFPTKAELEEALQGYLNPNTIILFKASRGMAFETLVQACITEI